MTEPVKLPEISAAERQEAMDRIVLARLNLVMNHAFFGVLATKLIPVENNTWCQTMAVDGKHLYYNVRFILGTPAEYHDVVRERILDVLPDATEEQIVDILGGLTDANMIAVICHEILHCAFNHFLRRGSRDPQLYNKAADYAINQIIKREKIGEISKNWLFDERFDGMPAEEIYNILEEEQKNGEGEGDTIDQHMAPGEKPGGKKRGKVGDVLSGEGDEIADDDGEFPEISEEEMEKNMDEFQNEMQSAARQAGNVPAEIARMIHELKNPKIDWRTKLDRTLRSFIRNDATWTMPNRRSYNAGVIFPGLRPQEVIDICVAIDTSGSISTDMLRDFLSEVYGMTKQFQQFKIRLVCFDTDYYNPKTFDENNVDELLTYDLAGFGGTDFMAVWRMMEDENYKPHQLVMFTDGYPCASWGIPEYCKTLFVLHGTDSIVAPFGETTYYDDYKD